MTTPLLQVRRAPGPAGPSDAPPEWLVANGVGGYALGSVDGVVRRRHHGLLVAALPAPLGRCVVLQALDEDLVLDGRPTTLQAEAGIGDRFSGFALVGGLPVWTFDLGDGRTLERAVLMPHGDNTTHVRYRLSGGPGPMRLRLRPWFDVRGHNGPLSPEPQAVAATTVTPGCLVIDGVLPVSIHVAVDGPAAAFDGVTGDRRDTPLPVERDRGYDWHTSAWSPGAAVVEVDDATPVYLTVTCQPWAHVVALPPEQAWETELARRERLLASSHPGLRTPETMLVALATDQFVIRTVSRPDDKVRARAAGAEARAIIAGYPWFTDWGRDTMISLEGLTLTTGRHAEARDVLRSFALHVRHGLIPNLFPEGERHGLYHTADATLWFFHALDRYDTVSGDQSLVRELLDGLCEIVARHRAGTDFGIRVDADGLLTQGAPDLPLTWMDARMEHWVVTPRRGKAVEINALWYNALRLLHGWLARVGRGVTSEDVAHAAHQCREAFNQRFWYERGGYLFDIVDGEQGDDASCRPNQLFAVSLTHPVLDPPRWTPMLEVVTRELLTPLGLRTLARGDPHYQSKYFGPLRERDGAYHQGTVWPWLLGPFADAWLKVHPDDTEGVRTLLDPLLQHVLSSGCLGSVSEIFDPEPPYTARGCVAQAWSVSELARLLVRLHGATAPATAGASAAQGVV